MDRRFFLFLVLSLLIFLGWQYVSSIIWPPDPKKPDPTKPQEQAKDQKAEDLASGVGLALAFPDGLPVPHPRALASAHADDLKFQFDRAVLTKALVDVLKTLAAVRQTHREAEEAKLEAPMLLGGKGYKLSVAVSPRGAAIKTITCNEYYTATVEDGRADPERKPLMLVNDNWDGKLKEVSAGERMSRLSYRLLIPNAALVWRLEEETTLRDSHGQFQKITFVADAPEKNVRVKRVFELKPGQYHIDHMLWFEAIDKEQKAETSYVLTGPRGLPVEGEIWKQGPYWHVVIGTTRDDDQRSSYRYLVEPSQLYPREKPAIKPLKVAEPGDDYKPKPQAFQYAGVLLQYFAALTIVAGDPTQNKTIEQVLPEGVGPNPKSDSRSRASAHVSVSLQSHVFQIPPGQSVSHTYLLYAGPAKVRLLHYEGGVSDELVDRYENFYHLNNLTDYPFGWFTSGIGWTALLVFFTNLMHSLLQWLSSLLYFMPGRYGIAILLITVIVRAAMFPISRKQAMTAIRMQKLAPELKKLKEQYKDDRQKQTQAMMELYRKHGVSPFSGCLVLLLQLPIFLGLYYALNESVNLRLASFLWIDNLASPDMLLYWGNWPIIGPVASFLNLGPYINILPLISVALMIVHQKLFAPPAMDEQQALQMKIMSYMMVVMAYFFYWIAAGLCVYFCMSSAWGLIERRFMPKSMAEPAAGAAAPGKPSLGKGKPPEPQRAGWRKRLGNWWSNLLEKAKKK